MKGKMLVGFISALALLFGIAIDCNAELAGGDVFSDVTWDQVFEENLLGAQGVVQSICATENYIITIENISESGSEPDVVSAYYRNDTDGNGNPVTQYSLAKRSEEISWEHGNGMAYNPNTKEIYVALYTNVNPESRGCIFVMDPDTLAFKRTVKISDEYNILGIGYKEDTDQYVIQTNVDGGYSFKILNADFQVVDDLGEYASTTPGNNFQDLEVCGDYIINFPLTFGMGIGDFIHIYSISGRAMVSSVPLDFQFQDILNDEPESICELEPGVFLTAVNVTESSGARKIRFYKTTVPYYFNVTTTAENGQLMGDTQKVLRGENCSFGLTADEGFELSEVLVNGEKISLKKSSEGFMLENIQEDQNIQAVFSKIQEVNVVPVKSEAESILKKVRILPVAVGAGIGAAGAGVILFWAYIIRVRRERRRKYLRRMRNREAYRMASGASR